MNIPDVKRRFLGGIIVTLVLGVIVYLLINVIGVVKPLIAPITDRLGIKDVFGEITITFLAILIIVIVVFILGSISILPPVYRYKDKIEDFLVTIYPPLNYFKVITEEKFQVNTVREEWKCVLALIDGQYMPAFIIEENDEWVTLSVVSIPNSEPIELLIVRKDSIHYLPLSMKQMLMHNRKYGKGYLSMIPSASEK